MNAPQPVAPQGEKLTTKDYLLIIFAGVFAHPSTFADVASFVDDDIVGDDKTVVTLWRYLQAHPEAPSLLEVAVDLVGAGVDDVLPVIDRLAYEAEKLTPARVVANARKLARNIVNARRREYVKRTSDTTPLTSLDVESIAADAAKRYPHTTPGISTLTVADCEHAVEEVHATIPTGFGEIDRHTRGLVLGEQHLLPARTGDGKSSLAYSLVRNQFFANAAQHREGGWWSAFGPEWRQHGTCPRRRELLRPLHAGHDDKDEERHAPRVLWFSLEEPLAQVLARFYCDLLTIDRQTWTTNPRAREELRRTYARDIAQVNEVLGAGRLTVVDYTTRRAAHADGTGIDAELARQTLADIQKKTRAWRRECERANKAEGVERPGLVLVDYGQLIQVPDTDDRFAVLDEVSRGLTALAKEVNAAFLTTLMLLRGHESVEPTGLDIKGSSQFAQDAARIWTAWPFGKRERQALREAVKGGGDPLAVHDSPLDDDAGFDIPPDNDAPQDIGGTVVGKLALHCTRALREIRISAEKDRFGDASWQTPLAFDGRYARVTNALPDVDDTGRVITDEHGRPRYTSYRNYPKVMAIVQAAVKVPKTKQRGA